MTRFVYSQNHPVYGKDSSLDWYVSGADFIVVIDTETNIAYTGESFAPSRWGGFLADDVERFVKGE
jgi:hypothetical protein